MDAEALVCVVDDDASMRESLQNLLRSVGLRVEVFASAQEFLHSTRPDVPSCLVLDVRLPGLSGLELQQRMVEGDMAMPIIFITGHGDIPMTVQAMKAGAVKFLAKPFRDQALLDAIQQALDRDRTAGGTGRVARAVCTAHATRARSDGAGRDRVVEQANHRRTWYQRNHGQALSLTGHAQDAGRESPSTLW